MFRSRRTFAQPRGERKTRLWSDGEEAGAQCLRGAEGDEEGFTRGLEESGASVANLVDKGIACRL